MPAPALIRPLYAPLEGPVSTLYAEVAERARAEGPLLPGTPGSLSLRDRADSGAYWYRRHYDAPGTAQVEHFVCRQDDQPAREAMQRRIEAAEWTQQQVRSLRQLGLQVADKDAARVLVEMHNRGLFEAGMVMVGTLAFMAWLNELGAKATASRTQDIDLASSERLKLAVPASFLDAVQATGLGFFAVPGMAAASPPTSVKRAGREGLRVDILTAGPQLGKVVRLPELDWHAQAVPHFDYLLEQPRQAAMLAGGHCVPLRLPAPERMAWHKLYSSTRRLSDTAKAGKDLHQAATLLAVLAEHDNLDVVDAAAAAPRAVIAAARQRLPALRGLLAAHPQARDEVEQALRKG